MRGCAVLLNFLELFFDDGHESVHFHVVFMFLGRYRLLFLRGLRLLLRLGRDLLLVRETRLVLEDVRVRLAIDICNK